MPEEEGGDALGAVVTAEKHRLLGGFRRESARDRCWLRGCSNRPSGDMQLHLHVGHGKTGSSFLQSWWALNRAELWQVARLLYPVGGADRRARAGAFSMGNGLLLDRALQASDRPRQLRRLWADLLRQVPRFATEAPNGLVFSAERWARVLPQQLEGLLRVADAGGVEQIRIWLLVRDPLDHALSVYGQMVKRHGFTGSLDDWLEIYDFPQVLLSCLNAFQSRPDRMVLRLDHYGQQRRQLLERMQAWLQLPSEGPWQAPVQGRVNRSLSTHELLLMRWLNSRYSDRAAPVGEALVDRLPNLAPARLQPSAEAVQRFLQRWSPVVDQINALLPAPAQLQLVAPEAGGVEERLDSALSDPAISLLPEQLDCLVEGLQRLMAPGASR